MLLIYSDCYPVGWKEFAPSGFAREILHGCKFDLTGGEDERIGTILHHGVLGKVVVVDVVMVASREFFVICDAEGEFDEILATP